MTQEYDGYAKNTRQKIKGIAYSSDLDQSAEAQGCRNTYASAPDTTWTTNLNGTAAHSPVHAD